MRREELLMTSMGMDVSELTSYWRKDLLIHMFTQAKTYGHTPSA